MSDENPDKSKNENPVNKQIEFAKEEKNFQPMFNMDVVYDEEIYNYFDFNENIQEDEEIIASGDKLVNAINLQDKYYKVLIFQSITA